MRDLYCPYCRQRQPSSHAYCIRCGEALPGDLLSAEPAKSTRFFAGIKVRDDDPEGGFLRVSCYRRDQTFDLPEGSVTIPGHHIRFSFWVASRAECVISLPEAEGRELASFLGEEMRRLDGDATNSVPID